MSAFFHLLQLNVILSSGSKSAWPACIKPVITHRENLTSEYRPNIHTNWKENHYLLMQGNIKDDSWARKTRNTAVSTAVLRMFFIYIYQHLWFVFSFGMQHHNIWSCLIAKFCRCNSKQKDKANLGHINILDIFFFEWWEILYWIHKG